MSSTYQRGFSSRQPKSRSSPQSYHRPNASPFHCHIQRLMEDFQRQRVAVEKHPTLPIQRPIPVLYGLCQWLLMLRERGMIRSQRNKKYNL